MMTSPQDYLESIVIDEFLIKTEKENDLENSEEDDEDISEISKCGEIFVTNDGSFQVQCKLCNVKYKRIRNFLFHTLKKHFWPRTSTFMKEFLNNQPETICSEDKNANLSEIFENNAVQEDNKIDEQDKKSDDLPLAFLTTDKPIARINIEDNQLNSNDKNDSVPSDIDNNSNYDPIEENDIDNKRTGKYKCSLCPKKLKRKSDLTRHTNCHKKNENRPKKKYQTKKNYVCEVCGVSYRSNYFLKEHLRVHSGERPFKCELCPQTFAKRAHMLFHVRYHLNDRRFKCQYCGKGFVESTKRKLHEMIHTNEFPFECEFCDKKFRCRSKLNVHLKRHINDRIHKCDLCDKRFFDINLLKGHQAVHSEEKPFACEICPARFPRKGALRLHKQLHLESKNYVCKVCGKSFAQYNGIYSHMKSHGIKYSSAYEKGEAEATTSEAQITVSKIPAISD